MKGFFVFDIIKSIISILVLIAIVYFLLNFFGYEINQEYFSYSKKQCEQKLQDCTDSLIHNGIDNVKCNMNCVEPKLIIKKKNN